MNLLQISDGYAVDLVVGLPHGVHARPAARIAQTAREFKSHIKILSEDAEVSAKSMLDILSLALSRNDHVRVFASGPDATEALKQISVLITGIEE